MPQLAAEGIVADLADQSSRGTELCRSHRLIGTLATREEEYFLSCNGLAELRVPRGGRDNVHVDAAGYPDVAHGGLLTAA